MRYAPPHRPGHPPLVSLRSLAPPYAARRGLWIPAFAGMTVSGGRVEMAGGPCRTAPGIPRVLAPLARAPFVGDERGKLPSWGRFWYWWICLVWHRR